MRHLRHIQYGRIAAWGSRYPPRLVFPFFEALIAGPNGERPQLPKVKQRINSTAQDAIFIVSNSRIVPSKHLSLGLAIKRLMGSIKVIQILNRIGHVLN
jgi:hypothetical protein